MRTVWLVAANSWRESLRSRFFVVSVVFSVVLVFISMIFGVLAVDQELRVLTDFGLGFIELLTLAGALFAATSTILRELETKTIYLVLTRPVSRGQYLLGRYAGLLLSAAAAMAIMAALHVAVLLAKGWTFQAVYLKALAGAYLKVTVTAALGLCLALYSSSALTALIISGVLWALGHFLVEIRYLIEHGAPRSLTPILMALAYVPPDLNLLNARDRLGGVAEAPVWTWLAYTALYAGTWLLLARALLRKKEL